MSKLWARLHADLNQANLLGKQDLKADDPFQSRQRTGAVESAIRLLTSYGFTITYPLSSGSLEDILNR